MADVLAIAAASMAQDVARMTTISHNLANALTPGFRREMAAARPFIDHLGGAAAAALLQPAAAVLTDQRQATLRATGAPLDLALEGEGFFEVQAPDGPAYTRHGEFHLDAGGRLVTSAGLAVMGQGGDIVLGSGRVRVDAQGRVFEDDRPAGQLRLVRFEQASALRASGDGLFRADGVVPAPAADLRVRQGQLENSNVSTMTEMVRLIETMRHFEASQRLVQNVDDSLGRAIRTLGEF